ncbi:protein DDI1 homolog 2-like [Saccoglossus kowalevskii]|uniref:Protein DDI1 homolog 2-like n=1 Tax=Saccoglossus kowalevskii TaxID=10224 RepID=A0ABM0MJB3_SACKO|nr:PREDICTED: protein DDI1 homolog 2-like [Saccoglossus kowalevskii]
MPQIDFSGIQVPGPSSGASRPQEPQRNDDPVKLREMLLANPHQLALLKERNPPLAEALLTGDIKKFTDVLKKQQNERAEREMERIRLMNADPFDAEAQQNIAEEIRLRNVEANMESAMEYNPESFGQVIMLYIDCRVNGHPVKAFVDSG